MLAGKRQPLKTKTMGIHFGHLIEIQYMIPNAFVCHINGNKVIIVQGLYKHYLNSSCSYSISTFKKLVLVIKNTGKIASLAANRNSKQNIAIANMAIAEKYKNCNCCS